MPTIANKIEINVPPQRVWELLTALRYAHLWLADATRIQAISTDHVGAGTTFEMLRGGSTPAAWIVSAWQPHQHLCFSTTDGDAQYSFMLEPTTNGTQVTMEYHKTGRGLSRFLPVAGQRRLVQHSLARLRDLITFNRDIALIHGVGDE